MRFKVNNKYVVDAKSHDDAIRVIKMLDAMETYSIRWIDTYAKSQGYGPDFYRYDAEIKANNVKEALEKLAKKVALGGTGTANCLVMHVSNSHATYQFSGRLSDLLKKTKEQLGDSVKDGKYVSELKPGDVITKKDGSKWDVVFVRHTPFGIQVRINSKTSPVKTEEITYRPTDMLAYDSVKDQRVFGFGNFPYEYWLKNNDGEWFLAAFSKKKYDRSEIEVLRKKYKLKNGKLPDYQEKIVDSAKDADAMKFFNETLNFDRTTRCDWCGKTAKTAITHYGTSHYNRLICKECANTILHEHTHDAEYEADVDLDFLIKDEIEAIDGYRKMIAKTSNPQLLSVLSHILDEETEHVEELRAAQAGVYEVEDD